MSAHKKSPARRRRANTQPHKGVGIMPKHNSTATSGAQAKRAYRKPEILAETRGGEKRPADHLPLTREIESAALHLSGLINAGCPLNDDLRALKRVLLGAADMARALESRAIASAPEASSQGDSADGTRRELIYLAAPYSHPDPWVRQDRAGRITEAAARLIADGWAVFSPISHGVLLVEAGTYYGLALDDSAAAWERVNDAMLAAADRVMVLNLEGLFDSVGVRREVALAARLGKRVDLLSMGNTVLWREPVDPMLWSDEEGRL